MLRSVLVLLLGPGFVGGAALSATSGPVAIDRMIDFQQYRFGVPPSEFDYDAAAPFGPASVTNRPTWRTYVDPSSPSPRMVLIRSVPPSQGEQYPIAVLRDVTVGNVNLAAGFKLLGGDTQRSAGLLWRAQGTNDYHAVLVSALHREIRLLRMENGRLTELAKAPTTFDETDWNSLEVSVQGERVNVWLNERSVLEARDAQPSGSGRVGMITAADTVALFDDFHVWNGQERVMRQSRSAPPSSPAPVLHVNEIFATFADFKTPCHSFRAGDPVRWRVQVADELQKPSPAAIVECELAGPDGKVLDRDKAMTGTDGVSLFTRSLATNALPGVYTVRVKDITHANVPEGTYSSRANIKSAATFKLSP